MKRVLFCKEGGREGVQESCWHQHWEMHTADPTVMNFQEVLLLLPGKCKACVARESCNLPATYLGRSTCA